MYMWQMGDRMVHIRTPHSNHWHLISCPAMASRLVSQHKRNRWPVSIAKRWQLASCTTSCQLLVNQVLFEGPKRRKPTRLVTGYGAVAGKLWTTFVIVLILCPVISICLDALRSTWLARDLQQMPVWSCHPTTDTWHQFLLCWITSIGAMIEQMLICQCWLHRGLMCALHASKSA